MSAEKEKNYYEFSFKVSCNLCKQTFELTMRDTHIRKARRSIITSALEIHDCPAGHPTRKDLTAERISGVS